jgi:acyl dehydratase
MAIIDVEVGDAVRFAKTVSETDVYLYAGITGDFSSNHVNEEAMRRSPYGRRIAHGALVVGFFSTASTMITERSVARGVESTPVSLGYDRIRFLKPVFFGDTLTVRYAIVAIEQDRLRTRGAIEARNQRGELVAVGEHILKWIPNDRTHENGAAG